MNWILQAAKEKGGERIKSQIQVSSLGDQAILVPAHEMGTTGGGRVGFGVGVRASLFLDIDEFELTVEH